MRNSLPGNPFVGEPDGDGVIDAVVFSADDSPMQATEFLLDRLSDATLALAYEQRTATLVQAASHGIATDANELERLRADLRDRLGLGGGDS